MSKILANLPKLIYRKKKRLGRGLSSGKGAKSGRGITRHQKARESIPLHFEGGQGRIIKKFPLLRGKGRNKPLKKKKYLVKLSKLNIFKDGEIVDLIKLKEKKIIDKKASYEDSKLIGHGEIKKKLRVKLAASKSAKQAIEKAGGQIIL
ncbi:MAG: 50S ribosomal protein L15 [Microgenomates group bacterium]|nr:50S ribosomal protein L15 [Microgenomates group bacterium]